MKTHTKRPVRLSLEQLEERCVPAYLVYSPQRQEVRFKDNTRVVNGFQLQATISRVSDVFQARNGQSQVVVSTPTTFAAIGTPTEAEWTL
jgi:hypothetical protein